jgi:type IV pilus assembly protein PilA
MPKSVAQEELHMLTMLRQRRDEDEGFTLIELMVVVLIIAILIAIAIPTFLGAQDRARDRGAQSDLRNALTASKTLATDNAGLFFGPDGATAITAADMEDAEPSLEYDVIANATTTVVGVSAATNGTQITLEKGSASGTFFGISASSSGEVSYCKSDTKADCAAGVVADSSATDLWLTKW